MKQKIDGFGLDELVTNLSEAASKREAYDIIGKYMIQWATGIARSFTYGKTFAAAEPGCAAKFTRSFTHKDWKDGQDLVQAEQGAGEDGFNFRFHRIESDLDALALDSTTAFNCLKTMRQELSARLEEIRLELNRINVDIKDLQECCQEHVVLRPDTDIVAGGRYLGKTEWFRGRAMNAFETSTGVVLLPEVEDFGGAAGDPRIRRTLALAKLLDRDPKLRDTISSGRVSKEQLVKEFGDLESDEFTLRELLDILATGSRYSTPETLLKAVADREASSVRASGMTDEFLGAVFSGQEVIRSTDAPIENFELVPSEKRSALVDVGVKTVGDLAALTPTELASRFEQAGVQLEPGDAAAWTAGAQLLTFVR